MKNFKVIKESWDRFVNEQEEESTFMNVGNKTFGKIQEIINQAESLIANGAVFFDTETTGLSPNKNPKPIAEAKPSDIKIPMEKTDVVVRHFDPPNLNTLVLGDEAEQTQGDALTEIAATYITKQQMDEGVFPSKEGDNTYHRRIIFSEEDKKKFKEHAELYKLGTIKYDPRRIKGKLDFRIKYNKIADVLNQKIDGVTIASKMLNDNGKPIAGTVIKNNVMDFLFNKITLDELLSNLKIPNNLKDNLKDILIDPILRIKNEKISNVERDKYFDLRVLPKIKSPHQLLLMTAYFDLGGKSKEDLESNPTEDFINLNLKLPNDTNATDEKQALIDFYEWAEGKNEYPFIAQNASFDDRFISDRAKLRDIGKSKLSEIVTVKDTKDLLADFREKLNQIKVSAESELGNLTKGLAQDLTKVVQKSAKGQSPEDVLDATTKTVDRPELVANPDLKLQTKQGTASLGPMADALKVTADNWHTAIADIEILFKVFHAVLSIYKDIQSFLNQAGMSSALEEDVGAYADKYAFADISADTGLQSILESIIDVCVQGIDFIDKVTTNLGANGSIPESKKVSKKPIRENKAITIRIGKW